MSTHLASTFVLVWLITVRKLIYKLFLKRVRHLGWLSRRSTASTDMDWTAIRGGDCADRDYWIAVHL